MTLGELMALSRSDAMARAVRRAWDRMRARQRRRDRMEFGREEMGIGWVDLGEGG